MTMTLLQSNTDLPLGLRLFFHSGSLRTPLFWLLFANLFGSHCGIMCFILISFQFAFYCYFLLSLTISSSLPLPLDVISIQFARLTVYFISYFSLSHALLLYLFRHIYCSVHLLSLLFVISSHMNNADSVTKAIRIETH